MQSLWGRIGLGAGAVFVMGMLVVTGARKAGSAASGTVREALLATSNVQAAHDALADLPFHLAHQRIGTIKHFNIERSHSGDLPRVVFDVELANADDVRLVRDCDLLMGSESRGDFDFDFACARSGADLVRVGEVSFEPGGVVRPLVVARVHEGKLRQGDPFKASADLGGALRIDARGEAGELVRILAGEGKASLYVQDGLEPAMVKFLADSNGASMVVRDKNGREIVRMQAGEGGFQLTVDSAGVD